MRKELRIRSRRKEGEGRGCRRGYGGLETFFRGVKGGVDIGDRRRGGGNGERVTGEGSDLEMLSLGPRCRIPEKRKIEKILFLEERGKGFFFLSKMAFLTLDNNCFSVFYCFILPSDFSMLSS